MNRPPTSVLLVMQAFLSLIGAIALGILGSFLTVYVYDRGLSKGNDLAVALIGLHAVGTFVFVTLLTFLWYRSTRISWKTPVGSLAVCLAVLLCTTLLFSSAYDEYFAVFFILGWISVALSGALALGVCRYIVSRSRTGVSCDSVTNS